MLTFMLVSNILPRSRLSSEKQRQKKVRNSRDFGPKISYLYLYDVY